MFASLPIAAIMLVAAIAAAAQSERRARTTGRVRSVTSRLVYLDAGLLDGLAPGQLLDLRRRGGPAGRCRVVDVADRHATCIGPRVRRGDEFSLPLAVPGAGAPVLPPALGEDEVRARRVALADAPIRKVRFKGGSDAVDVPRRRAATGVAVRAEALGTATREAATGEGVRVSIREAQVARNVSFSADLRGARWSAAPRSIGRIPEGSKLYVSRLELAIAPSSSGLSLGVGRNGRGSSPWAPIVDGVRVSHRHAGGEAGAYAGLLPDPLDLTFRADRTTAGAYLWRERMLGGALVLRDAYRLAAVSRGAGGRAEAAASAHAWVARIADLAAEVHSGTDLPTTSARVLLDAARLDAVLGGGPFAVSGAFRYTRLGSGLDGELSSASDRTGSRRAFVDATVRPAAWLSVRGVAGAAENLAGDGRRTFYGPEVVLARSRPPRLAVALAWTEEPGDRPGRALSLRGDARTGPVRAYGSVALTTLARASDPRMSLSDVASAAGAEIAIGRGMFLASWMSARLGPLERSASLRSAVLSGGATLSWRPPLVRPRRTTW